VTRPRLLLVQSSDVQRPGVQSTHDEAPLCALAVPGAHTVHA
jgi:hypothetical protein